MDTRDTNDLTEIFEPNPVEKILEEMTSDQVAALIDRFERIISAAADIASAGLNDENALSLIKLASEYMEKVPMLEILRDQKRDLELAANQNFVYALTGDSPSGVKEEVLESVDLVLEWEGSGAPVQAESPVNRSESSIHLTIASVSLGMHHIEPPQKLEHSELIEDARAQLPPDKVSEEDKLKWDSKRFLEWMEGMSKSLIMRKGEIDRKYRNRGKEGEPFYQELAKDKAIFYESVQKREQMLRVKIPILKTCLEEINKKFMEYLSSTSGIELRMHLFRYEQEIIKIRDFLQNFSHYRNDGLAREMIVKIHNAEDEKHR